MFPSWFLSRWRLSPLFDEGAQILYFPAPISYLGDQHSPAAGLGWNVLQFRSAVQGLEKKDVEEGGWNYGNWSCGGAPWHWWRRLDRAVGSC